MTTNTDDRIFSLTDNTVVHIVPPSGRGASAMGFVNGMSAALGRGATWTMAAAFGLVVAEVYYVQPELAAIVPTLRMSDVAVSLMSAVTQQGVAGDDIPLGCKLRLAARYLLAVASGLLAHDKQARRVRAVATGAARGRLRPVRRDPRSSAVRWESRRRPVCGSCRARFSPSESSAVSARRARP
jgi:hypothetical protein